MTAPVHARLAQVVQFAVGARALRQRPVLRNSAAVLAAQLARLSLQAAYFVLVARSLGPEGYGAFVTVAALVGAVAPFAAWGAGDWLVQRVARDRETFREEWSTALLTIALVGGGCGVLVSAGAPLLLPPAVPTGMVACVAAAEFWFAAAAAAGAQAFQAHERLARTGQVWVLLSACRLCAAAAMAFLSPAPTPLLWGALYLASTAVAAAAVMLWAGRELGRPFWRRERRIGDGRQRLYYSVALSANSVYNDIDKTMLGRLGSVGAAGVYAAGYRAVEMAFAPVNALLFSSYPQFFQHGINGIRANVRLAGRLLPAAAGYGALAGAGLYVASGLLGRLLDDGFGETGAVVRALALVPLLRAVHFFAANALTGADRQAARSTVQVAVAVTNVGLNAWLIPAHGWHGAAWATLATEALLAVALWCTVLFYAADEGRMPRRHGSALPARR